MLVQKIDDVDQQRTDNSPSSLGERRMSNLATIYVALLDEDVDVWRPVQAEHVAGDLYRLIGEQPDDEAWPFAIGDVVRCKERTLSGDWGRPEPVLVAYEKST
jgi:hypothetical protein